LWANLWDSPQALDIFDASLYAVRDYIALVEHTESPKQYHLWSLISLTAALASNSGYLSRGIIGRKKLNLGIVLIGRPAVRKSSAINFMQRFARSLSLNYGPTDTGGARHGIMTAMQARWQDDYRDRGDDSGTSMVPGSLDELGTTSFDSVLTHMGRHGTRPSSIFFASKELGRLLTSQTRELLDFFADGLDNEPIFYQTKSGNIRIPSPLINLLGATTPGNLASILPRDSHTHGILSRIIFVYAGAEGDSVPIPPEQSPAEAVVQERLLDALKRMMTDGIGEITFSEEAEQEYVYLYNWNVPTLEFRLNAYASRRSDHLARIAALVCLLRGDSPYVVNRRDVALAHVILGLAEIDMDGAYVGLDKSIEGRAYAIVREVLESMPGNDSRNTLYAIMGRAGFDSDDTSKIFQRLVEMNRLISEGHKIRLGGSVGASKLANYVRELGERLRKSA
jgi:hypothetical protein